MERAWRAWEGAVSGCESSSVSACVIFVFALTHLVCDLRIILMSCFLVLAWSPPTPPPQVALLLSVSRCHAAASPTSLCVCVCSALGRFLFAAHMLLPKRVCPLVRWTLEALACRLCPCQGILDWLFSASEGGQTSSLFCFSPTPGQP